MISYPVNQELIEINKILVRNIHELKEFIAEYQWSWEPEIETKNPENRYFWL